MYNFNILPKKFQNTPVKIYQTSDRTYVPKNRVSLSIFGLPHVVNEPDYSSHRVLIEYRTFEQNDLSIWLFERMEVKSKKNFVQN